mmetsp:Transcript_16307/g.27344  ORF Transcript_16307/g.27344 Transcript_16307/m.27344 type:complete len:244 (-) Transcript_16307:1722-2453(-)
MSAESSTTMITSVCDRCRICFIDQDELLKKNGSRMKSCANCGKAWYCSKECQKNDWKMHKILCTRLKHPEDLVESWKNDHITILYSLMKALVHSDSDGVDLSSTHCAVLQVEYKKHNEVPFQIKSYRTVPDTILVSHAHDVCDDQNNPMDIGARIPSTRAAMELSRQRAGNTRRFFHDVLGLVVCTGLPDMATVVNYMALVVSDSQPANPRYILSLVELCNTGVGDESLMGLLPTRVRSTVRP